jgi:hypothetical protein
MGNLAFEGEGSGDADSSRHDLPHRVDVEADRRRLRDDARRGLHAPPR